MKQESDFQYKFKTVFDDVCCWENENLILFLINKGSVDWDSGLKYAIEWHQVDTIELLYKLSKDAKHVYDFNPILEYACEIIEKSMARLALNLGATNGHLYDREFHGYRL